MSQVDLHRATVRITSAVGHGTGFFVEPRSVATCAHLVGGLGEAVALAVGAESVTGTVLQRDRDVAIVRLDQAPPRNWPVLSLAESLTEGHRNWNAYGFPGDGAVVLIDGEVRAASVRDPGGRDAVQLYTDANLALDGYAGAAVFSNGRVIAQLRGSHEQTPLSVESLRTRLRDVLLDLADLQVFLRDPFPEMIREIAWDGVAPVRRADNVIEWLVNRNFTDRLWEPLRRAFPARLAELNALGDEWNDRTRRAAGYVLATPARRIIDLLALPPPANIRPPRPPDARLPYDSTWYVHRREQERKVLREIEAGKAAIVMGPMYFGKSSFLQYIVQTAVCQNAPARLVEVDLGALQVQATTSLAQFQAQFFRTVANVAGNGPQEMDGTALTNAFRGLVGAERSRLYLVLYNLRPLLEADWRDRGNAFIRLVRSWLSISDPVFKNLRLLIEGTQSAVGNELPAINNSERITLDDFSEAQTRELAGLYGVPLSDAALRLLRLTIGGHPYLLSLVMYTAASEHSSIEAALDHPTVFQAFVNDHLMPLLDDPDMRSALCAILCSEKAHYSAIMRLAAVGVVEAPQTIRERARIRYSLFEQHLDGACNP